MTYFKVTNQLSREELEENELRKRGIDQPFQILDADEWTWWREPLRYHAGEIGEELLIDRATPFCGELTMANYAIALRAVAEGDRGKAKRHFEEAVAHGRVGWWWYHSAQFFLARMDEDETWPNGNNGKESPQEGSAASTSE